MIDQIPSGKGFHKQGLKRGEVRLEVYPFPGQGKGSIKTRIETISAYSPTGHRASQGKGSIKTRIETVADWRANKRQDLVRERVP